MNKIIIISWKNVKMNEKWMRTRLIYYWNFEIQMNLKFAFVLYSFWRLKLICGSNVLFGGSMVRSLDFEERMTSADHPSNFDIGQVALFD